MQGVAAEDQTVDQITPVFVLISYLSKDYDEPKTLAKQNFRSISMAVTGYMIHYQHKGKWYAKVGLSGSPQKLNMRSIQQHGRKWRVQKRTRGHLRKWTYDSLPKAQRKRDKLFG